MLSKDGKTIGPSSVRTVLKSAGRNHDKLIKYLMNRMDNNEPALLKQVPNVSSVFIWVTTFVSTKSGVKNRAFFEIFQQISCKIPNKKQGNIGAKIEKISLIFQWRATGKH